MFLWNLPLNFRYDWEEEFVAGGGEEGRGVKMKRFKCRKLELKYKNLKVKKQGQICHSKTGPPYHISSINKP